MASASTGTRIIPTGQQQAINLSTQQSAIVSAGQRQPTIPSDEQQATISSRPVHDAPPEERSSYSLTSMSPDVAVDPLKNSPAVSPGENAAVPNDGGYVVQVLRNAATTRHNLRSRPSSRDTHTSSATVRR